MAPSNFFMVIPFLRDIKAWVKLYSREHPTPVSRRKGSRREQEKQEKQELGAREKERPRGTPIEQPPIGREMAGNRARVAAQAGVVQVQEQEDRRSGGGHEVRKPLARRPDQVVGSGARRPDQMVGSGARRPGQEKKQSVEKAPVERQREKVSPAKSHGSQDGKRSRKKLFKPDEQEKQQEDGGLLLPPGFCPKVWTNFKFDHNELMAAAMGLAVN